jgi:hypothetical protein
LIIDEVKEAKVFDEEWREKEARNSLSSDAGTDDNDDDLWDKCDLPTLKA